MSRPPGEEEGAHRAPGPAEAPGDKGQRPGPSLMAWVRIKREARVAGRKCGGKGQATREGHSS